MATLINRLKATLPPGVRPEAGQTYDLYEDGKWVARFSDYASARRAAEVLTGSWSIKTPMNWQRQEPRSKRQVTIDSTRIVNRLIVKQSPANQPVDQNRRPTVAVDFDGRLAEWREDHNLSKTEPREGARRALERFRQAGIVVIIWTVRSQEDEIKAWMARNGIPYDVYNVNPNYETGARKIFADVYLDDRGEGEPDASWDDLVDLVFGRIFGKAKQPVDSWEELEELSERGQPELEQLLAASAPGARVVNLNADLPLGGLESLLLQPGPVIVLPPVKAYKRAREKVESDYDGEWDKLLDVNRGAIAFDTKQELDAAADRLRSATSLARPPKDRFAQPLGNGYRDLLLNPRLPCGMVCEVQLHLKPMLMAREREKLSYDVVRAIQSALDREGREEMTPAEAEAVRRARKMAKNLYARAWDECQAKETAYVPQQKYLLVNRLKHLITKRQGPFGKPAAMFEITGDARDKALAVRVDSLDLTSYGREDTPHVTVAYGLKPDAAKLAAGFGPVTVTLGKVSVFPPDSDHEVLKIDVVGDRLQELHDLLADGDSDHPYQPHVTLAYVKPGAGAKYAGAWPGEGTKLTFDVLTFADRAGGKTIILLGDEKRQKSARPVNRLKASYFETCDRDDKGRCKPGSGSNGGGSERPPAKPTTEGGTNQHYGNFNDVVNDPAVERFLDEQEEAESQDPRITEMLSAISDENEKLISKEGDKLVGAVSFNKLTAKMIELNQLGSIKSGVGGGLVRDLQSKYETIVAVTVRDQARGFYEKLGFKGIPGSVNMVWDKGYERKEKGLVGDSVQFAGRWLAAKWENLESRYGRRGALAVAVAMIGTAPLPGNIAAVIAAAEAIRGLHGFFTREFDGDVEKLKGDTVMDVAPQYQLRFPVDRLKHLTRKDNTADKERIDLTAEILVSMFGEGAVAVAQDLKSGQESTV